MANWKWSRRHRCFVRPSPVPGIFERQLSDGLRAGYVVRTRVVDRTTGRAREVKKILPTASLGEATTWLETESVRKRTGTPESAGATQTRFAAFAASLFEHKVKVGDIKSASGRNRWVHVLKHLIVGVTGRSGLRVRGFGDIYLDKLTNAHVEEWKEQVAALIAAGDYAPPTANGWLAILRVVMKAARRKHALQQLATDGVTCFDESEHVTYSKRSRTLCCRPRSLPSW